MRFENALQQYIDKPEKHPKAVLYSDEHVCIIKDLFPKAMRHLLVLPRSSELTLKHPLQAFGSDVLNFVAVSEYIEQAKSMIVDDFIALGLISKDDKIEIESFRNTFIKAGVHSIPSLKNLHIHVITQDFFSSRLKHKKHYNSFNSGFFVEYETLEPTEEGSEGYNSDSSIDLGEPVKSEFNAHKANQYIKTTPLTCSYCKQSFGNSFQRLKQHLETEFRVKFNVTSAKAAKFIPNGF